MAVFNNDTILTQINTKLPNLTYFVFVNGNIAYKSENRVPKYPKSTQYLCFKEIHYKFKIKIMKNLFKFSLLLVVTLFTINLHASDVHFSLGVKKVQGRMVTFSFGEIKQMELSIYDAMNVMVYTENIDYHKFINRTYDLKNLPEGVYYLVAESDLKRAKYRISIVGENAELSETPISEEFKPLFFKNNGLIKLNFLNINELPTVIKIYNRDDVLVYDSGVINDQTISKVFDIYNIENEEYTIIITNNNNLFSKTFDKK
jgi:hypothetical protein